MTNKINRLQTKVNNPNQSENNQGDVFFNKCINNVTYNNVIQCMLTTLRNYINLFAFYNKCLTG